MITEFHRFSAIFSSFLFASSINSFNFMVRWMCVFLAVKFHPKDIQSTGRKKNEKYTINANFVYQYEKKQQQKRRTND